MLLLEVRWSARVAGDVGVMMVGSGPSGPVALRARPRGAVMDQRGHDVSESPDRPGFWSIHGALLEGTGCLAVRPWQWMRVGRREVPGRAR